MDYNEDGPSTTRGLLTDQDLQEENKRKSKTPDMLRKK